MKIYRLGACLKCRGDLALDEGDWLCLQCGLYYYTGLYTLEFLDGPYLYAGDIFPEPDSRNDSLSLPAWLVGSR